MAVSPVSIQDLSVIPCFVFQSTLLCCSVAPLFNCYKQEKCFFFFCNVALCFVWKAIPIIRRVLLSSPQAV